MENKLLPCASRWEHAMKVLNAYRNAHYADALTEEPGELANAINDILPFAVDAYRRAAPANPPLEFERVYLNEPVKTQLACNGCVRNDHPSRTICGHCIRFNGTKDYYEAHKPEKEDAK